MVTEDRKAYGIITIKPLSQSTTDYFTDCKIKSARISVSCSDIKQSEEPFADINITSCNFNSVEICNIPSGKNRIITIQFFDENKKELPCCRIRGVTDICSDKNNVVALGNETTSYGNVIYALKDFFSDLSEPGEKTACELEKLKNAVDSSVHPILYDWQTLAGGYMAFTPIRNKSDYILSTGSLTFDYLLNDKFTVHVDDPLSSDVYCKKAGKGKTITGIAPGTWNLYVKNSKGNILEKMEISIKSGEAKTMGHLEHNGIAILVNRKKRFNFIHYWNINNADFPDTKWPGEKFSRTVAAENAEASRYYVKNFRDFEKLNCLITNRRGKKFCKNDIEIRSKGVYIIHENGAENLISAGEKYSASINLSDYPLSEENFRTFYYDDFENRQIIMLFNPETWNKKNVTSAKIQFTAGINDVSSFCGPSCNMKKDSETGVWYAAVPYSELRETNQSGQPTYRMKIDDTDFDCAEALNSMGLGGYVYTKFISKTAQTSLPCIIYNRQKKDEIISRLKEEKHCKTIQEFDLSTEEGQMELANFRLIPGTKNIYRSYHPYAPSKTEFETEPYRMYYIGLLGEKYGIKADINVSGNTEIELSEITIFDGKSECIKTADYAPEYYKSIISEYRNKPENQKPVILLTKEDGNFGYDRCYSNSKSAEFAENIAALVKFMNNVEGPYQLHCAIGTDRTGIVCAILSGLCGATYQQIEEDYCASRKMGILEYRGPGCVRYALEEFIGSEDVDSVKNLQKAMIESLVAKSSITRAEVEKMIERVGL